MNRAGTLTFQCNICGTPCEQPVAALNREISSCMKCGSTVRMRGMVYALSMALFGRGLALPDFPEDKDIIGKGTSDWDGYAVPLAEKFAYTNTYYHKAPLLDITNIAETDAGSLDFLLSTDVFEHVAPPVSHAFENARKLLKPDGAFIFSVPYKLDGDTVEHFPDLHDFTVESRAGGRVLINSTKDGRRQEFDNLVYHGGEGETLEMRVFSETGLLNDLEQAGFADVEIMKAPFFEFGIWWPITCSLPLIARQNPVLTRVDSWGPTMTRTNTQTNPQLGGGSGIWIKLDRAVPTGLSTIFIGDNPVSDATVAGALITGIIPRSVMANAGNYPVVIKNAASNKNIPVGVFTVCD
jgi:SAM-dependent methyltransferase